ncbi:MAG: hypothetical protein NTY77_16000 [Elusimicrobia bacterium]|nr:hypothetical protein [Elusimicrobiota bacterium]
MSFFPEVERWELPEWVLTESLAEMAIDGRKGNEGVALWLGERTQRLAKITNLVLLRGPGVVKEPDFLQISPALLNDVADKALELGRALIGQIHSHGEEYGTNLSLTDRRYGFAVPYYLSVVAPDFALRKKTAISQCGVHVFEDGRGYRRLPPEELRRCISMTRSAKGGTSVVGDGL